MQVVQIAVDNSELMHSVLDVFADAFDEQDTYRNARPSETYFKKLLSGDTFIALAALDGKAVIGGLAAYELRKFEQDRSEIYIYDLAVELRHRRRGVATELITSLREIAAARGAHVIFVQADYGDDPAINLYEKLGKREEVLHFDIDPMSGVSGT